MSEIDDFRKRIPDNPCNGISGCCTQEHQCGEGEGICEATNNSTGCMSGFECATCVCPPNDNICPDGESEFDCCTSESTWIFLLIIYNSKYILVNILNDELF